MKDTNRLYDDLAWLWPLWGEPTEYAPYCQNVTGLIRQHAQREVKTLLNICCGGGKNIYNLKREFTVTGLDLSPAMLDLARGLNPECRFVQGDMRIFSMPEKFDAILVDDGIAYITSEADLRRVFERCFDHLEPGGVMFVGPDETKENFVQNRSEVTPAAATRPAGIDVIFIENNYDPDPTDTIYDALMIYIIRENGKLRIEHDLHHLGLFPIETWRKLLPEIGFEVRESDYHEGDKGYIEFVCIKPK
jgi:SAM-dependent methyltransferase